MSDQHVDVDLDALAPPPRKVKLAGKVWQLPGDMPMDLFVRTQGYQARVAAGEDEAALLLELQDEILALFQVHQPKLAKLPPIGLVQLLQALGHVYGGSAVGEQARPNRATRRARTRTPSSSTSKPRAGS